MSLQYRMTRALLQYDWVHLDMYSVIFVPHPQPSTCLFNNLVHVLGNIAKRETVPKVNSHWYLLSNPIWTDKWFSIPESTPSFGQCNHQWRAKRRLHTYWSCRYCASSGRWCVTTASCEPIYLASLYWISWICIQKYQVNCRVFGWWAHQCCQGITFDV